MKNFIAITVTFLCIVSCSGVPAVRHELTRAESLMESRPDSALAILEGINTSDLVRKKDKAAFALSMSMALDKNYIDVTDDSLISRAVSYYGRKGSPDQKLKSCYYMGVIASNRQDDESAMEWYVKAEDNVARCRDNAAVGRHYKAKMVLYQNSYDFENAIAQAESAAKYYLADNDSLRYYNVINDLANLNNMKQDFHMAGYYLGVLEKSWNSLTPYQKSLYYSNRLVTGVFARKEDVGMILSEYTSGDLEESLIKWISVAEAHLYLGEINSAQDALNNHVRYGGRLNQAYYWIDAQIKENLDRYEEAMDSYKKYIEFIDKTDVPLLKSETKYIEERYNARLHETMMRFMAIIMCLIIVIILLAVYILTKLLKKSYRTLWDERARHEEDRESLERERKEAVTMYESLKKEVSRLSRIKSEKGLDNDVRVQLEKRLKVLNMFILAEMSDSFNRIAYEELGRLIENRDDFMISTSKTFMLSHPEFLEYLKKHDLSEWEIGCCCLYCIGFNGVELSDFLNRKAIYNINGTIRQKLGIPKSFSKIDLFLQNKMNSMK